MKVGIFGDSYCDKNSIIDQPSWFEILESYGHKVKSYGEGGSSVLYSASLLDKHAEEFDFLIWGVTNPPRLSITIDHDPYVLHFTSTDSYNAEEFDNIETRTKVNAACNYYKHLLDVNEQNLVASALINYMMSKYPNLMIIPCFYDPLKLDFNLFDLCSKEINYYFPNMDHSEFYQTYTDMRRCHLSKENNKILADLVAKNLQPGIFQTNYKNFVMCPGADKTCYFKKC